MNIQLTDTQNRQIGKNCKALLRSLNVKNLTEIGPEDLSDEQLKETRASIITAGRGLIDRVEGSGTEKRAKEVETTFDALMDAADALAFDADSRSVDVSKRPVIAAADQIDADAIALKPAQRMRTWAEAKGPSEYSQLGLGKYLRAMILGAKTDLEKRALSEGTDSAGGFTVPDVLSASIIDRLRAKSVVN